MNYIHRLQARVTDLEDRLDKVDTELREFRRHLFSEKFWVDTTIQVSDVHRYLDRIQEARHYGSLLDEDKPNLTVREG